jgi:hypothetical protein
LTTIADIFHLYGAEYFSGYCGKMLPSHKQAMRDILVCRTKLLGGHTWYCENCREYHYNYSRPVGIEIEIVLSARMKDVKNGCKNRLKNLFLSNTSWQHLLFLKN